MPRQNFEDLSPEQREQLRRTVGSAIPGFARNARKDILNQFDRAGDRVDTNRLTEEFLTEGGETRRAGLEAIKAFNPEDFLGADALQDIFAEATATNFAPQLSALQARNARRGVRGPLASATEGTLVSAFHRNLMARVAENQRTAAGLTFERGRTLTTEGGFDRAQGLSLFGAGVEMNQAEANRIAEERARRNALLGGLVGLAGRGVGALRGGGTEAA